MIGIICNANCQCYVSQGKKVSMLVYDRVQMITIDGETIYNPTDAQIDEIAHKLGCYYEVTGKPYGGWEAWQAIAGSLRQINDCSECPYSDDCEAYNAE